MVSIFHFIIALLIEQHKTGICWNLADVKLKFYLYLVTGEERYNWGSTHKILLNSFKNSSVTKRIRLHKPRFVPRAANSAKTFNSALCILNLRRVRSTVLKRCLSCDFAGAVYLKHWINISISVFLFRRTGLLCHSYHWAGSAYNSQHPFMAVAFCGAACIFVSSDYSLCSGFICFTFRSVLVFFHKSSIVCSNNKKENCTELSRIVFNFSTDSATSDSAKSKVNHSVKWCNDKLLKSARYSITLWWLLYEIAYMQIYVGFFDLSGNAHKKTATYSLTRYLESIDGPFSNEVPVVLLFFR